MRSIDSALAPLLAAFAGLAFAACGSDDQALADRQQAVAEAGAEVMPFNLDATTHVFTDTPTGGIQDAFEFSINGSDIICVIERYTNLSV